MSGGENSCCGGTADDAVCGNEQSCKTDPNCLCYCAVACNPRPKKAGVDQPLWFPKNSPQDPWGQGCYCAPRDLQILQQNPTKCAAQMVNDDTAPLNRK